MWKYLTYVAGVILVASSLLGTGMLMGFFAFGHSEAADKNQESLPQYIKEVLTRYRTSSSYAYPTYWEAGVVPTRLKNLPRRSYEELAAENVAIDYVTFVMSPEGKVTIVFSQFPHSGNGPELTGTPMGYTQIGSLEEVLLGGVLPFVDQEGFEVWQREQKR